MTLQIFPETDHGVEAVGGTTSSPLKGIAEEPHIVPLNAVNSLLSYPIKLTSNLIFKYDQSVKCHSF